MCVCACIRTCGCADANISSVVNISGYECRLCVYARACCCVFVCTYVHACVCVCVCVVMRVYLCVFDGGGGGVRFCEGGSIDTTVDISLHSNADVGVCVCLFAEG